MVKRDKEGLEKEIHKMIRPIQIHQNTLSIWTSDANVSNIFAKHSSIKCIIRKQR